MLTLLLIFSPCFLSGQSVYASQIISIRSLDIKPYNDALKGFKEACQCDTTDLLLTELYGINVKEEVLKNRPDAILAIGIKALKSVRPIKDIPIISLMVLKPYEYTENNSNISGVDMFVPPERQLAEIRKVIPHIKSIGLLYDPDRTGRYVENIKSLSKGADFNLVTKKVRSSKEVPSALSDIKTSIDALWVIPDLSVVKPASMEYFSLFSVEHNIPIISFSSSHLKMGALVAIDIDSFDMGRQAWDIADTIISEGRTQKIDIAYARRLRIQINQKTAKNFGMITINNRLIRAVASHRE